MRRALDDAPCAGGDRHLPNTPAVETACDVQRVAGIGIGVVGEHIDGGRSGILSDAGDVGVGHRRMVAADDRDLKHRVVVLGRRRRA